MNKLFCNKKKKRKNMDFEFLVYLNFNVWLIFKDFINNER